MDRNLRWEMVSSQSRYQCLIRKLMISAVIATQALQSILIELQGTLLRHLWAAQENDNMTDFNVVVDASDFGRIRSVTVLNELYMRMAQAAPIQWQPPNMERVHTLDPTSGSAMPWETVTRAPPGTQSRPIVQALPSSPTLLSSSPNDSADLANSIKPPGSTGRKWGIPFKSRLLRDSSSAAETSTLRDHNISNEPVSKSSLGIHVEGNAPSIWEPPPQASIRKPSTHESHLERPLSDSWKPSPELRIDENNPWREETSASSIRDIAISSPDPKDTQGLFPGPRRIYTGQTLAGDEGLLTRKFEGAHISSPSTSQTSNPAPSIMSETASPELKATSGKFTSMFRRRTTSDAPQVVEKPPKPPLKRLDNSRKSSPIVSRKNFDGFCKGAYKFQVGLIQEAMKICNQSISGTGQSFYWACASSKCCFEGPAVKVDKAWEFDNTVRTSQGIRYRWTLLAKSHVAMSRVKNHAYDYQCLFCVKQNQPAIIYSGDRTFLEHISTHRGQPPSLLKHEKISCKNGRIFPDHEVFDVNFPPSAETAQYHGRTLVNSPSLDVTSPGHTISPEEEEGFEPSTPEPSLESSPWKQQI